MIKFVRKVIVGVAISYAASSVVNLLERARLAKKAELDNEREKWGVNEEGLRNALRRVNNATEEMRAATANLAEEVKAYEEVFGKVDLEGPTQTQEDIYPSMNPRNWRVISRGDSYTEVEITKGEGDYEQQDAAVSCLFLMLPGAVTRVSDTVLRLHSGLEKDHDKKPRFNQAAGTQQE